MGRVLRRRSSRPLPVIAGRVYLAGPVQRDKPGLYIAMKRRIRPILKTSYERVLHRVDVAVLDVSGVVCVVSNQMLPKASLPKSALAARLSYRRQILAFRQG